MTVYIPLCTFLWNLKDSGSCGRRIPMSFEASMGHKVSSKKGRKQQKSNLKDLKIYKTKQHNKSKATAMLQEKDYWQVIKVFKGGYFCWWWYCLRYWGLSIGLSTEQHPQLFVILTQGLAKLPMLGSDLHLRGLGLQVHHFWLWKILRINFKSYLVGSQSFRTNYKLFYSKYPGKYWFELVLLIICKYTVYKYIYCNTYYKNMN